MKNNKIAFLVIDFSNEFVTGKVKSSRAIHCIKPAKKLIEFAHKNNYQVIYVNDMHSKNDRELKIWGSHSLKDSKASKVIKELPVSKKDIILPKHTYSAFFKTKLDKTLKSLHIDTLVIFGLYTNICVKYSLVDAYLNGYKIYLANDATDGFTKETFEQSINEIKTITDAKILSSNEIIKLLK